jgi:acyl transferase domain-containing protein
VTSGIAADLPNRVSHVFGFTGPSVAVDASCSSSLAALHLAVESLRSGACDAAVVAGVNVVSHPYHLALLGGLDLLGSAGDAFDAEGSGWLPGEGVGAMLVRRADAAVADGDPVHAVVEDTWIGHSGRTSRFGAPAAEALAGSLRAGLEHAGLGPDDIGYVELAAAGAAIADAAEVDALEDVFGGRDAALPAGTVKPNLGHLEAASGMSQLAKVLLQLRHRTLAPTLVAANRNPLTESPALRVVAEPEPWPDGARPRRALVNALGATGSYAHVVLREAGHDRH